MILLISKFDKCITRNIQNIKHKALCPHSRYQGNCIITGIVVDFGKKKHLKKVIPYEVAFL